MTTKTTSQKHAHLKSLAKKNRLDVYEMIRLASDILADHEYVDSLGGEAAVLDMLAADEFAHFPTRPAVKTMVDAYRANPDRKTWKEYAYSTEAMVELAKPEKLKPEGDRTDWKALAKEREARVAELEAVVADLRARCSELSTRVEELLGVNGELRGRIKARHEMIA